MKVTIKEHYASGNSGLGYWMVKAENHGIYNIESEKRGVGYVVDKKEFAIVTASGYLRTDINSIKQIAEEILLVLEDVSDRDRMGLSLAKAHEVG